jgi:hypothetical protein
MTVRAVARASETTERDNSHCRLRVWFEGHEPLEYRAPVDVAHHFAMAAHTVGAVVTIDNDVRDDLRPLPCERLWL